MLIQRPQSRPGNGGIGTAAEVSFFGSSAGALFGCYHPPHSGKDRDCGVVLCYPMGHEYIRAHRACRLLATRLAAAGYPVLRFDYYGSGDSAGSSEDARLGHWLSDIASAVEHLRQRCCLAKICLVGLRLGGSLALLSAARRGACDSLVLWQPVVSGRGYVDELRAWHRAYQLGLGIDERDCGEGEILGFAYSHFLFAEIESVDLLRVTASFAEHVLIVDNADEVTEIPLKINLEGLGVKVDYRHVPDSQIWLVEPHKALLPHESLKSIVSWIAGA